MRSAHVGPRPSVALLSADPKRKELYRSIMTPEVVYRARCFPLAQTSI